jgi:hypothetical protein
MKNIRQEIDKSFEAIVNQINARITLGGDAQYLPFVKELNLRIEHYKSRVAIRRG